jgi:hypothetical protein
MDISIITTSKTNIESFALLKEFGLLSRRPSNLELVQGSLEKGLRIKEKTNQTSHLSLAPFLISFPKGDGDKNGDGEWG